MPTIELRNLCRSYLLGGEIVHALRSVNLRIESGEYVAIIGQSGSGKSTLMNLLGCLDAPSSGALLIDGLDAAELHVDALADLRRQSFGFVFQRYFLLPHLDAVDNAALPGMYAGVSRADRRIRAEGLLCALGLGDRLHHRPNALSGGQQQRVSIARALMNGAQIILADEPTGALDSQSGAQLMALLDDLNQKGHTVILITHDDAIAAHAHRVIRLHDGEVLHDSSIESNKNTGSPAIEKKESPKEFALAKIGWWWRRQDRWREAIRSAAQSLYYNRLRSILSMLGISIGIAAVVSIMALTTAARNSIEDDVRGFLSGRIPVWRGHPSLPPGTQPQAFKPSEINAIRALPGVRAVTTEHISPMTARHASSDININLLGAQDETLKAKKLQLILGRTFTIFDDETSAQIALIDTKAQAALFRTNESPLGKTLFLAPTGLADKSNGASLPLKVVGIVSMVDSDASGANGLAQVLIPVRTFTRKVDSNVNVDQFNMILDFASPPSEVRKQMTYRLKALHGIEDFESWNADEEYRKIQSVAGNLALLLAGVGIISLLVGGVGVMNIMIVSVTERTREIGIRMAIGATQNDVRRQFMVEAVVLCCIGGAVGVVISWLSAFVINFTQDQLKVEINIGAVGVAFCISGLIGIVFGTLPARRASALSPMDALARE